MKCLLTQFQDKDFFSHKNFEVKVQMTSSQQQLIRRRGWERRRVCDMTAATSRHCQTCCLLLPQYRAVACLAAVPARMFVYILIFTELFPKIFSDFLTFFDCFNCYTSVTTKLFHKFKWSGYGFSKYFGLRWDF